MKKPQPKPLFATKHEFYPSLDKALEQGMMLIQAVETVLELDAVKESVKPILRERVKAFSDSLMVRIESEVKH